MTEERCVIPDQVLESQICRLCNNYLTVSPISVHPEGGNVCGRCQQQSLQTNSLFECNFGPEQIDIPYGIFGYVNHLFPCINRYEGCRKLLKFPEINAHEKKCQSRTKKCNICSYEGTGSQQLSHFRAKHPLNFFNTLYFRFPLSHGFETNLIKTKDDLFFVHFECDEEEKKVDFFVEPTKKILEEEVEFFCLLKYAGEVVDQATVTRRRINGIYHTLCVRETWQSSMICECLLRKTSSKVFL